MRTLMHQRVRADEVREGDLYEFPGYGWMKVGRAYLSQVSGDRIAIAGEVWGFVLIRPDEYVGVQR